MNKKENKNTKGKTTTTTTTTRSKETTRTTLGYCYISMIGNTKYMLKVH